MGSNSTSSWKTGTGSIVRYEIVLSDSNITRVPPLPRARQEQVHPQAPSYEREGSGAYAIANTAQMEHTRLEPAGFNGVTNRHEPHPWRQRCPRHAELLCHVDLPNSPVW